MYRSVLHAIVIVLLGSLSPSSGRGEESHRRVTTGSRASMEAEALVRAQLRASRQGGGTAKYLGMGAFEDPQASTAAQRWVKRAENSRGLLLTQKRYRERREETSKERKRRTDYLRLREENRLEALRDRAGATWTDLPPDVMREMKAHARIVATLNAVMDVATDESDYSTLKDASRWLAREEKVHLSRLGVVVRSGEQALLSAPDHDRLEVGKEPAP